MGDSVRAEDIETCKENIQPLREGRRTSTLKKIVTTTKAVEDVEKERQYVQEAWERAFLQVPGDSLGPVERCLPDSTRSLTDCLLHL
jgi:hypothetical protein